MRNGWTAIIAAAAVLLPWAAWARGDTVTPVYSFENPPGNLDGFAANGGGVTLTDDTLGATAGTNSLRTNVITGATFVGALTTLLPPNIGDPPGLDYVLFDLTIGPGEQFTGTRGVVGVTVFGHTQPGPGQQFGLPAQFADTEDLLGKAPGTYRDVRIDLNSATHPATFTPGQSFNDIFGTPGSGPSDLLPSGFQFFFSKSNDAPLTVYIDNVRAGMIPEPAALVGGCAALGGCLLNRRRRR